MCVCVCVCVCVCACVCVWPPSVLPDALCRPAEEADGSHGDIAPPVGEDVQENVQAENDVREFSAMNAGPGMLPPEQNNFLQDWLVHLYFVFCFLLLFFIACLCAFIGKFMFFTLILIVILLILLLAR